MALDSAAGMVSRRGASSPRGAAPARLAQAAMLGVLLLAKPASAAAQRSDTLIVTRGDSVSIRLVDVDLRAAVQALSRYLDRPVVFGAVGATRVTIETPKPVPRGDVTKLLRGLLETQSLELFADTSAGTYRVRPREIARQLTGIEPTTGATQGPVQLYVIHLRHARAADVAATVNALYGRVSVLGELGGRAPTLRRELGENRVPPGLPVQGAAVPEAVASIAGRSATLAGEITIVPDSRANSLLVRASKADFDLINAAVRELDIRPLQVLIEVLIAEVRKDRSLDFGVDVTVPSQSVHGHEGTTVDVKTTGAPGLSDFVVHIMKIGRAGVDVTLRAAAARGDVRILSRPIVIAANNEEAEIHVGSQRPFVQVARVLPTENTARDQIVQYKDVGTRLSVRPTISTDGYVMLRLTQEVNQATQESSGLAGVQAPVISARSVQTQLLIKDRQTVIIGGLTDTQRDVSQGGIPVLSSIPILGGLFGRASRRTTETELFLFLTPRVIRDDDDVEGLTAPLRRQVEGSKP